MSVYKEIAKYIDDECLIVSHGECEGVDKEMVEKWLEQHFEIKRKHNTDFNLTTPYE